MTCSAPEAAIKGAWYAEELNAARVKGRITRVSYDWVVGGVDGPATVIVPEPLPSHVSKAPAGTALSDLLLAGDIDALFAPLPPQRHHSIDGPIVRVFPDFRALEQKYFRHYSHFR